MTNTAGEDDKSHGSSFLEMVLGNYPSHFCSKRKIYLYANPERD